MFKEGLLEWGMRGGGGGGGGGGSAFGTMVTSASLQSPVRSRWHDPGTALLTLSRTKDRDQDRKVELLKMLR